ncbi:MAG: hypothetical protein WCT37_02335 [Patescibacteria group bacterium]|jgi:hypothetical protein
MSISDKTRKLLWAKAGNRCSYRHNGAICDKELIHSENDNYVIIGEECHIVDQNNNSTRYIENFPNVDEYENLILFCREHHKIIDSDGDTYTSHVLKKMKSDHENCILDRLEKKQIEIIDIKDSVFETEAKNVDEAIGMEVNQPANLSNVRASLKAENVRRAVGFSTNQGLSSLVMTCKICQRPFSFVCTGPLSSIITCPLCGNQNDRGL